MIIIGEKINSSLKGVTEAVKNRDVDFIQQRALEQAQNGADYIDVNCGTLIDEEVEALPWLVQTVQQVVNKPCCIDSPNPLALAAALKVHKGKPMINSITGEEERYTAIMPLVKEYQANIIALVMDDEHGMPKSAAARINAGTKLIERMQADGVPVNHIYIDPLVQPISTSSDMAIVVIDTIKGIRELYPTVHFMCGLSNVSFGLPKRGLLNRTFLTLCMLAGLDGAILDPGNRQMMSMVIATEALLNKDAFTKQYLKSYRKGLLE
ncbi:methyltetrahydrofolate cobalamin methyltransferase [Sporomusa sphaeroides DSM 2875]|uniref:methyltetrahydrofolate cobalamin methyltransferase n=1 Tax=Sporomusa sphaeroides TaxID=47679 RepID=UPI001663191D|nr:methyltetrahydrofolate cobalamin methyltransferase [Sporomusa sphaeroides]MCM0758193.1 methyltetrahydrofolate cobalamin methyltransferase [Sporomusa sphaeroides DSM 2875]